MKKIFAMILALYMIFALAACGEGAAQSVLDAAAEAQEVLSEAQDLFGESGEEEEHEIVIPDAVLALSEEEEVLLNGELKDNVYTNKYFGFRFTAPEGWTLIRLNDDATDPTKPVSFRQAYEEEQNGIMFMASGEGMSEYLTIIITALDDDEKGLSEEELVRQNIEDIKEIYQAFGDEIEAEYTTRTLAGEEHPMGHYDSESGESHYFSFYIPQGDFELDISITTATTDLEEYLKLFEKVGPDGEPLVQHGSLLYMGHASLRVTTPEEKVIYIDPYVGDYSVPADLILITHGHYDHNNPKKVAGRNEGCEIITWKEALKGGHQTFDLGYVTVEAVQAGNNRNHKLTDSVGYVLTLSDGIKIYVSGDTSTTDQMKELAAQNIDYAFFCCDGQYNMGMEEAIECAKLVGAKINIPYHMIVKDGKYFDADRAELFAAPNRLILADGEEIELNGKNLELKK